MAGKKTLILILTAAIVLMTTGLVAADANLPVQLYTQTNTNWANDKMGQTTYTLKQYGCLTTSLSMVFDCSFDITPKEMNKWLTNQKLYNKNAEITSVAKTANINPGKVKYIGRYTGADLKKINNELINGYPVIAKIKYGKGFHFFVITGYSGSTYYINDPLKNTPQVLNKRFGEPSKVIKEIIIFHGTPIGTQLPTIPTSLIQYKSDGVTGIALGGTTTENKVVMKGGVSDPSKNKVQLEVEVKPVGTDFTGTPSFSSSLVASGSKASVICSGLSNGKYHWQARVKNSKGVTGPWQSAGGNAENMPDFVVSATPVTLKVSPSSGKQGTTFTFRGDSYTKKGEIEFHVRKPDNTEYPVTTLTASSSGALSYKYKSTTSSMIGTYTIWAIDSATGRKSNEVKETITAAPVSIQYQAHFAYTGWMSNWVQDGDTAGTPSTSANQMEAIKIKTSNYDVTYCAHVAYDGWQSWVSDGAVAGTVGQGKSLQAIKIQLQNAPSNMHIKYRVYVNGAWKSWVSDGAIAGTVGQGLPVKAIQIKITT